MATYPSSKKDFGDKKQTTMSKPASNRTQPKGNLMDGAKKRTRVNSIRKRFYAKLGIFKFVCITVLTFLGVAETTHDGLKAFELFELSDKAKAVMEARLPMIDYMHGSPRAMDHFLHKSTHAVATSLVEAEEHEIIKALLDLPNRVGVLIRNTPVDAEVATPTTKGVRTSGKPSRVAEAVSSGIAWYARGYVVQYEAEKEHAPHPAFHEVVARMQTTGTAANGPGSIPYHLDMSWMPSLNAIPDILILQCVREGHDKFVLTEVVDSLDVMRFVDAHHKAILREDRFLMAKPTWVSKEDWSDAARPIVVGPEDRPTILLHSSGQEALKPSDPGDKEAWKALSALYIAIDETERRGLSNKIHLKEGDVLVIPNKLVLHRRTSFEDPLFDGKDRLLIRSYYVFHPELIGDVHRNVVNLMN